MTEVREPLTLAFYKAKSRANLLRLASDDAAPRERQNAYGRAQRELAGLVVLPAATRAAIERRVIGELEA